jgi:hypothetical protein
MTTHWPIIDAAVRAERLNGLASQLEQRQGQRRQDT